MDVTSELMMKLLMTPHYTALKAPRFIGLWEAEVLPSLAAPSNDSKYRLEMLGKKA
ncbi:hypothetical protein AVEN_88597-1, partial [Araneus ventricosus]